MEEISKTKIIPFQPHHRPRSHEILPLLRRNRHANPRSLSPLHPRQLPRLPNHYHDHPRPKPNMHVHLDQDGHHGLRLRRRHMSDSVGDGDGEVHLQAGWHEADEYCWERRWGRGGACDAYADAEFEVDGGGRGDDGNDEYFAY